MPLSLLVNIGPSSSVPFLGNLELGNRQEQSGDGSSSVGLAEGGLPEQNVSTSSEIRISLNSHGDVHSQIWQAMQYCPSLGVTELRILPNEIVSKCGRAWVRNRGKLSYDCEWLMNNEGLRVCEPKTFLNSPRQGSPNPRRIFQGFYEYDIQAAIERILKRDNLFETEIEREFRILRVLESHENFIRYFSYETDEKNDFVYIATELCLCSIADIFEREEKAELKNAILKSLTAKGILFQATNGLDYLHQNHFVHRNVKPSSFLVKKVQSGSCPVRYAIKITDFRLSRKIVTGKNLSGTVATDGWESPESRREDQKVHQSLDVFILGCFYYYIFTGTDDVDATPSHPFDDGKLTRSKNISNPYYSVYEETWKPPFRSSLQQEENAKALIKQMIQFDETMRPKLSEVLKHEFFQPRNKEYYTIYDSKNRKIRRLCVVFNQENFDKYSKLSRRDGTGQDVTNLDGVFKKLGFEVVVHHDLMSYDIEGEMEKLAARDFSDYGCLVVCLLSHGIENAIAGFDGRYVNINELKYKFSYDRCPSLYGKPKIFIVQSCQGKLEQNQPEVIRPNNDTLPSTDDENKASTVQPSSVSTGMNNQENQLNGNPPIMDFITIKSTIPGFVSWRKPCGEGSYFIQALCQKMGEEYLLPLAAKKNIRDLEGILRGGDGVQSIMNKWLATETERQTMSCETYLTKYIMFEEGS